MVKPFGLRELVARIRAVLRRAEPRGRRRGALRVDGLEVDARARRATLDGDELALTPKEFDLLALLAPTPAPPSSRERIFEEVWGTRWYGSPKTIDVHVAALRRKLGDPGWIETVRGVGFRLRADEPAPPARLPDLTLRRAGRARGAARRHVRAQRAPRPRGKVERDAVTVASLSEGALEGTGETSTASLRAIARRYQADTGGRVVVVDERGNARRRLATRSRATRSFASRPEIAAALGGGSPPAFGTRTPSASTCSTSPYRSPPPGRSLAPRGSPTRPPRSTGASAATG